MKILQVGAESFHADRHDDDSSRFPQYAIKPTTVRSAHTLYLCALQYVPQNKQQFLPVHNQFVCF